MAKSAVVRARIEPELKLRAEAVLAELGLTPTAAVTLFYQQVLLQRALPFPVALHPTAAAPAVPGAVRVETQA